MNTYRAWYKYLNFHQCYIISDQIYSILIMKSCLVKAFRLSLKIRLCFSFKLRENPRVVFDVLYFIIIFLYLCWVTLYLKIELLWIIVLTILFVIMTKLHLLPDSGKDQLVNQKNKSWSDISMWLKTPSEIITNIV